MTKIVKIGDILLDYPLFIKEEFKQKNVRAIAFDTIGGNKVVYESIKRNSANYITLISKDSGWLREETIKDILLLADDIEVETTITKDDGGIVKVRFAYEIEEIIKVEDVVNENGGWFKVEIALCMI